MVGSIVWKSERRPNTCNLELLITAKNYDCCWNTIPNTHLQAAHEHYIVSEIEKHTAYVVHFKDLYGIGPIPLLASILREYNLF